MELGASFKNKKKEEFGKLYFFFVFLFTKKSKIIAYILNLKKGENICERLLH